MSDLLDAADRQPDDGEPEERQPDDRPPRTRLVARARRWRPDRAKRPLDRNQWRDMSSIHRVGSRTMRTGRVDCRATTSATEPRTARETPERPWEPTTMTSTSRRSAA